MPFIQILLKRKKSRVDSKPCCVLFFFLPYCSRTLVKNKSNAQNTLCMNSGVIRFMYASFGMKERGGDPPDWQVVLLNAVSEELFT